MTRRLLVIGVALILIGGIAAVVCRASRKGRECFTLCSIRKSRISKKCVLPGPVAQERRIDLEVQEKPLAEVMNLLATQGLNLVYCHAFADTHQVSVTASLKQVTVEAAACAVLKSVGWRYELTAERILVVFGR